MNSRIDILKGIHPGAFLGRELKRRRMRYVDFARAVGEYPQTLSAIIRGRRAMNIPLSLRIERTLQLEEGLLMSLQIFYDIEQIKRREAATVHPDLTRFRHVLFWDTSIEKIDWTANKEFAIRRIFERGNEAEILETIRFYGRDTILESLDFDDPYAPNTRANAEKYLNYGR